MKETPQFVALGKLGRSKGLKGELFFFAYNPESTLLKTLKTVKVGERTLELESVQHLPKRDVVRFREIQSIDDAKKLTGSEIFVRREELPELPSGQHYVGDLVGIKVLDAENRELGTLSDVIATESNDIYVVNGEKGEILLPVLSGVIKEIDVKNRRMVVCPPETVDAF